MEEDRKQTSMGKGKIIRRVCHIIFGYIFCILLVLTMIRYIGQRTCVVGESMEPALSNGDSLFIDKISYQFSEPKRFDIIVFPYSHSEEKSVYYIKRIIALPGETIQIANNGDIYIDGVILIEYYGKEAIRDPGRACEEITLGEDEYFVLGDNRNNSVDSREEQVGNIKRSQIYGRACFRIWPITTFGVIGSSND